MQWSDISLDRSVKVNIGLTQGSPLLFFMVMELISMEISTNDILRKMMYVDDLAIIAESMQTIQNYKKCSRNGRGVREARTENEPGEDRSDVGWTPEREVEHQVGW